MKNFIYILTIGGLLWLFFNPNGIFAYNSLNKQVNREKKRLDKHKKTEQQYMQKINELNRFLNQENIDDKEYYKEYYPDFHDRNIKEKGSERVKFPQ